MAARLACQAGGAGRRARGAESPRLLRLLCRMPRPLCVPPWPAPQYHMTDQATCLLTAEGELAVDFIGRVRALGAFFFSIFAPASMPLQASLLRRQHQPAGVLGAPALLRCCQAGQTKWGDMPEAGSEFCPPARLPPCPAGGERG